MGNPNVTSINGVPINELRAEWNAGNHDTVFKNIQYSSVGHLSTLTAADTGSVSGTDMLKADSRLDDLLHDLTDTNLFSRATLTKLGLAGAVLDVILTANTAEAAYQNEGAAGAANVIAEWGAGLVGSSVGGWAAAAVTATAFAPLATAGGVLAVTAGVLTFAAGFTGGYVGDIAGKDLFNIIKGLNFFPDNFETAYQSAIDGVRDAILDQADANQLQQQLQESGQSVGEWLDDVAQNTGESKQDLLNDNKEFFGNLLHTTPNYNTVTKDNGDIILEGANGQDTVINGQTGEIHVGIPHNVIQMPNPVNIPTNVLASSPFLDRLLGVIPSTPKGLSPDSYMSVTGVKLVDSTLFDSGTIPDSKSIIIDNVISGAPNLYPAPGDMNIMPTNVGKPLFVDLENGMVQEIDPYTGQPIGKPIKDVGQFRNIGVMDKDDLPWLKDAEQNNSGHSGTDDESFNQYAGIHTDAIVDNSMTPNILAMAGDLLSSVVSAIGGTLGALFSGIGDLISDGISALGDILGGALDWLSNLMGIGGDMVIPTV